jgi:hypothetical protein
MNTRYSAVAESNSKDPHDWGRAMAAAMTDLVARSNLAEPRLDVLFGKDLQLVVTETAEGVEICLSWSSGDGTS